MPPNNLGIDVGTTGGNWLFKQGELLLGPVPFTRLVEMLYAGEVDATTPVAQQGGELRFRPLGDVEAFRIHLVKSQAKLRVEAQSAVQRRGERRGRLLRMVGIGVLAIAALLGAGRLALWLALNRPWDSRISLPEPIITDELPVVRLASARGGDEELEYPDPTGPRAPAKPGKPGSGKPARPGAGATGPIASARPGAGELQDDEVHSVQHWDQETINGIVRQNKKSLHRCLSEEASRQSGGWSARVPIEFTIGNDGRVAKLWIDNADYRGEATPLFKCMLVELKKWKFPAYAGEQANVSLAFQIQGR